MTRYIQDTALPSHGRRSNADNKGTVRVRISHWPQDIYTADEVDGFDLYLFIDLSTHSYHASAESFEGPSCHKITASVVVPDSVLDGIVRLASNKDSCR